MTLLVSIAFLATVAQVPDAAQPAAIAAASELTAPAMVMPDEVTAPSLVTAAVDLPAPAAITALTAVTAEVLPRAGSSKKTGFYVTGLPLVNSDPNTGIGYGARVYVFDNGDPSDERFAAAPYLHRIYAQFFQTTNGYQYQTLNWDAPYLAGSSYRVRANLLYERDTYANWFGQGDHRLRAAGQSYSTFKVYEEALRLNDDAASTYTYYNKYDLERPQAFLSVQRYFLGGRLRALVGGTAMYATVRDYSGVKVLVDGKYKGNVSTYFSDHPDEITGLNGGWTNSVRAGLALDTRDYEPDPNSGVFADVLGEYAGAAVGSEYTYTHYAAAVRGFYSPIPDLADAVLAGRVHYSVYSDGAPFYMLDALGMTDENSIMNGLGGLRTLRGYKANRFVDLVASLANAEIRYTFAHANVLSQDFGFMVVPFLDTGKVFPAVGDASLRDWRVSEGLGFRLLWNQATIILVDYAVSTEDSGLYINFNHMF